MQLAIDLNAVEDFCRRHPIRRLCTFGSVLRDDFRPDSDVDFLVEFENGYTPGLQFFDLEEELSKILGRRVDLNTRGFLSRTFRQKFLNEAQVVYAARRPDIGPEVVASIVRTNLPAVITALDAILE